MSIYTAISDLQQLAVKRGLKTKDLAALAKISIGQARHFFYHPDQLRFDAFVSIALAFGLKPSFEIGAITSYHERMAAEAADKSFPVISKSSAKHN